MRRAEALLACGLALGACRSAAEAVDVDVDEAEIVARRTGKKVAAGLESARDKVAEVGGDLRDAAQQAGREMNEPTSAPKDDGAALERDAKAAVACPSPGQCTITRAYVDRLRANPGFVGRQARAVPHRPEGRAAAGLEISALESLPMQLGFREGDVVRTINGLLVDSIMSAPQLYVQLESARHFVVIYERDGERQVCEIDIV
jgi:type II secretory pathway component PulC